jgi:hypothetical protein
MRGWTAEQIDEAVKARNRIDAINKKTGGPATRYVNPSTGQSVVIDNTTNEVIQVDRVDFEHGPESGDVPGGVMRAPPSAGDSIGSASLPPAATEGTSGVAPIEPVTPVGPTTPVEPSVPVEPVEPIFPIEPLP